MGYSRILSHGLMAGAAMFMVQSAASAQSVTGSIDATIALTSACEVNGSTATTGVDFGTLDFGSHTTLFTTATTELQAGAGTGISIQCSPGSDATLTITSSTNDGNAPAGSGRAMANGSLYVPYDIYSDAAYATVLPNAATIPVTADGSIQVVPIYGRALGAAALTPGSYTDTIQVTLDF